jgi:hypothetical protein
MDEDLIHRYGRWRAAESRGADEEADEAFKDVFAAMPDRPVSLDFTAQTMRIVAETAARDMRRARRTRAVLLSGGIVGGAVGAYYGAAYAVTALSAAFVGLLDMFVGAVVGTAGAMERGADLWSVLGSLGRAAAAFVADPKVTFTMLAIQGIAAAALIALQRLLGTDRETFK